MFILWFDFLACFLAALIHSRYSGICDDSIRQSSNGSEPSVFCRGAWHEMPYSERPALMAASTYSCGEPSA